ncbi:DUF1778 domain-containing protein [Demequina capsici]|uniref:DUF1778 domain-containing protein n=1 Tax=Demequina capsici TaxID=3075620 RepID=A0AA96F8A3_9MICO|nr:DUF1778 domain-containing protein [Demequina sp. OYTSA14]WNM23525.1 DUF1778 domain-containing protein [Demequina sp. OYTSA14]
MTATKSRLNMRVNETNLAMIREAAEANGQDMTSFVLGAALERARAVLIETRVTYLSAPEAARLESVLDADPVEIPALQRLLKSTLDREYSPSSAVESVSA